MEYLVLMKMLDTGYGDTDKEKTAILKDKMIPSLNMLIDLEKQGMVSGGFFEGQRSASLIVSAEDNEKLDQMLNALPLFDIFEIEVIVLEGLKEAKKREEGVLKGLEKPLAK